MGLVGVLSPPTRGRRESKKFRRLVKIQCKENVKTGVQKWTIKEAPAIPKERRKPEEASPRK